MPSVLRNIKYTLCQTEVPLLWLFIVAFGKWTSKWNLRLVHFHSVPFTPWIGPSWVSKNWISLIHYSIFFSSMLIFLMRDFTWLDFCHHSSYTHLSYGDCKFRVHLGAWNLNVKDKKGDRLDNGLKCFDKELRMLSPKEEAEGRACIILSMPVNVGKDHNPPSWGGLRVSSALQWE